MATSSEPELSTTIESLLNGTFSPEIFSTTSTPVSVPMYCSESWRIFWIPFRNNYSWAKMALCLLGLVSNILNILVFTRRNMRNPTNFLLAVLAIADVLCVGRELLYVFWDYAHLTQWGSQSHAINELVNEILLTLFHTWSVYLTMTIAIWRLLGVVHPLKSRSWCTWKGAKFAIFTSALSGLLIIILMYCSVYINQNENGQFTGWTFGSSLTWDIYVWTNAILIKTAPSLILTTVIGAIVKNLLQIKQNRKKLVKSGILPPVGHYGNNGGKKVDESSIKVDHHPHPDVQLVHSMSKPMSSAPGVTSTSSTGTGTGGGAGGGSNQKDRIEFDRTTRMLLVVLFLFVLTELPAGIGLLLNAILGYNFFLQCREPALAFFNFCDYMSNATSLFVYLVMGKKFRDEFFSLCTPQWCPWGRKSSHSGVKSTSANDSGQLSTGTTMSASR